MPLGAREAFPRRHAVMTNLESCQQKRGVDVYPLENLVVVRNLDSKS